jgi:hypothetical protein
MAAFALVGRASYATSTTDCRVKSTVALAGLVAINQPLLAVGQVMAFFAWHFNELGMGHSSCYALL